MKNERKLKLRKSTVASLLTTMEKANVLGGEPTYTYGGQYTCHCTYMLWCTTVVKCDEN